MARPLRIEYSGAFYHITSRGNEQKAVYRNQRDREKFLSYLESATARYGAVIHAYCLMDNHYHLLLETPSGNLSRIMHHINGAYTAYFNTRHERAGHLFQGRYKAILIDADEYAKELSRYIHLNPVRAGIVDNPEEYKWSSCQYYTVNRKSPEWLERELILGYFGEPPTASNEYRDFIRSAMDCEQENPMAILSHSVILGNGNFVDGITDRFLRNKQLDRDLPALKNISSRPDPRHIEKIIDSELQSDEKLARQVKLHFYHRYSGMKLREIGKQFGIGESGVTQASQRISAKAKKDKKLKNIIKMMERKIILSNV